MNCNKPSWNILNYFILFSHLTGLTDEILNLVQFALVKGLDNLGTDNDTIGYLIETLHVCLAGNAKACQTGRAVSSLRSCRCWSRSEL